MWISVKDRMPEEYESMFERYYGTPKWSVGMFRKASSVVLIAVRNEEGTMTVIPAYTTDGEWKADVLKFKKCEVTHWMPFPEPPKE